MAPGPGLPRRLRVRARVLPHRRARAGVISPDADAAFRVAGRPAYVQHDRPLRGDRRGGPARSRQLARRFRRMISRRALLAAAATAAAPRLVLWRDGARQPRRRGRRQRPALRRLDRPGGVRRSRLRRALPAPDAHPDDRRGDEVRLVEADAGPLRFLLRRRGRRLRRRQRQAAARAYADLERPRPRLAEAPARPRGRARVRRPYRPRRRTLRRQALRLGRGQRAVLADGRQAGRLARRTVVRGDGPVLRRARVPPRRGDRQDGAPRAQ